MEKNKSFLNDFYDLGQFLAYIGCFYFKQDFLKLPTVHNSYKWSVSLFILGCFMFFGLQIINTILFWPNIDESDLVKCTLNSLYLLLYFMLVFTQRKTFINLLFELEVYDKQRDMFKNQPKRLHKKSYGKTWVYGVLFFIFVVCSYFGVAVFTLGISLVGHLTELQSKFCIIETVVIANLCSLPFTTLYLFFSCEISIRYMNLHKYFMIEFKNLEDKPNRIDIFLDHYRLLYFQLSRALNEFNRCFGYKTVLLFFHSHCLILCMIWDFLVTFLFYIHIGWLLRVVFEIYIIAKFSEDITSQSKCILDELCGLPVSRMSLRCQKQVHLFILQVHASEQGVFAAHLFEVKRSAFVSILTSAAAYCTVMVSLVPNYLNNYSLG